jgi:hypothetical protein
MRHSIDNNFSRIGEKKCRDNPEKGQFLNLLGRKLFQEFIVVKDTKDQYEQ